MKLYILTAIPYSEIKTTILKQKGFGAKLAKTKTSAQESVISTKEECEKRAKEYDPKIWRVTIKRCKGISKYRKKVVQL